jgi:hypothetical protein
VEQNDEADDAVGRGAQDGGDGAQLGGALRAGGLAVCQVPHAVDEEGDDSGEDKGDEEDKKHSRQVAVDEGEQVAVPVVEDVVEGGVVLGEVGEVLRSQGEEEHDGGGLHF